MLVMVHRLEDGNLEITALNFGREAITGTVRSEHLPPGSKVLDMFTDEEIAVVDDLYSFSLALDEYEGRPLLVCPPPPAEAATEPSLDQVSRRV
jgi:hypothetical protein